MIKFIELYIGAIILWTFFYKSGKLIFNSSNTKFTINQLFILLIFSGLLATLNFFNTEIFKGVLKIISVYILFCGFYSITFKKQFSKILTGALILYLSLFVAEVLTAIIVSIIFNFLGKSIDIMKNTIIINAIIVIIEYSIVKFNKNKIQKSINNTNLSIKNNWIIIITILVTLSLLVFKIPLSNWKFDLEFIITMIILFCFCIVGLHLLKLNSSIEETLEKYNHELKYSKVVSKVTAEYRKANHEHKNELSIIRGMAAKNDNKKLLEYLDILIEKKNNIKYKWSGELIYLPLDELKSLMNYKLVEMENQNIDIGLTISRDISKMNFKNLDINKESNLYNIIGIYLDNAMQAALESKERIVNIDIHRNRKNLVFIVGNTYMGKINLEKIDEYGYTTKGKNHGIGLNIVRNILEDSEVFSQTRKIIDNYFVQELVVNITEMKKHQRKKKKTTK